MATDFAKNRVERLNVVSTSPTWSLNGVNIFAANLTRGLLEAGVSAKILLTRPDWPDPKPMPLPVGAPVETLDIAPYASWQTRWRAMIRYLEKCAPCIYIPNYDVWHSCVSPKLSHRVGVVGIVHSDDPQHYEHASRLGRYWNATVAVSPAIATRLRSPRLTVIPYGVDVPTLPPERRPHPNAPLKIVYAGRLENKQKRIFDLPKIIAALRERGVAAELSILGEGTDREPLMKACAPFAAQGIVRFLGTVPNARAMEIFEQSDAFILTSEFEGLPLSLLEAMGRGCVPVTADIRSGIPDLIEDGANGYLAPVGDIETFADRLALLQRDMALRQKLAANARQTICDGRYRIQDMVKSYIALFERVLDESAKGAFRRPDGPILRPPTLTRKNMLSASMRAAAAYRPRFLKK